METDWKYLLKELLLKIGILTSKKFTGEISIGFNEGGIRYIRRNETITKIEKENG